MRRQVCGYAAEAKPSDRELAHGRLARKAAAEGMVLLKNQGMLPLEADCPIALFGGAAVRTVKGGTGSGDVNNRESISVYQGMKAAGAVIVSEDWLKDYEKRYAKAREIWKEKVLEAAKSMENPFDAYAENPFLFSEGRAVTVKDTEGALAAVYVLGRISGEGRDRRREEGDYYLSKREKEDLFSLKESGLPIVLILNVGAPVELTDILNDIENIRAVLHISLPGQEGGHAVSDVLFGYVAPGGRLTDTWAMRYEDYPSAESFGYLNGNLDLEEYREGIYVGYRYFDSFGVKPLFPFGFGLSYTSFSVEFGRILQAERGINIEVSVKNIGDTYSGREVVQVYVSPPQTEDSKELRRLAGFAKTSVLRPQETQTLSIFIEQSCFSSFSERRHSWYVEAGTYGIWVGKHIESLRLAAFLTVRKQTVLERTEKIHPISTGFDEPTCSCYAVQKNKEWIETAKKERIPVFSFMPEEEKKKITQTPLAKEQTVDELIPLLYGNITQGTSTLGSAGTKVPGSAGETTEMLEEKFGLRSLIMADGPAGLRLRQNYEIDRETGNLYGMGVLSSLENGFLEETKRHENSDTFYQYCTAFPVGTALAQSWDTELMREFGKAIAIEMKEFHVDLWLAPGMNIHRNPLCGRNFEYYSEDPVLSGTMAAHVTEGVQSYKGCGVAIKHFACNNQEDNRMGVDVRVSERTLREIYLRGFEIAVKKSMPVAIMSAYNLVNGIHAANNRDICTVIAREEWGFEGIIMSDWNTTVPEDGSVPWQCIAAGNDVIMPGNRKDDENIRIAYGQGELTETMIRRSAGRICSVIRHLTG